MFDELSTAQWLWYFHNFMEDKRESFEHNRDMVEYHASFIEPEVVGKIREARDEAVMVPDEEFEAGLEHFFGRKVDLPSNRNNGKISSTAGPQNIASMGNANKELTTNNSQHWVNMELG